jgi:hypothetical protein
MGGPAPGGGFTVDVAALQAVAAQLGRAKDDVDQVRRDFDGDRCFDPAAFGDFGLPDAYTGFSNAWVAELAVTSEAVGELVSRTELTVRNYRETEERVKSSMTPR